MTNPADRSLPSAELNPLLNPLLGRNMGRWAEVYFTAVPEKREEAVHKLLRELEAEESEGNPSISAARTDAHAQQPSSTASDSLSKPEIQTTEEPVFRCPSCDRENPADQKFCGACGTPLREETATEESGAWSHQSPAVSRDSFLFGQYAAEPYDDRYESRYGGHNLDHMFELTESSRSYRGVIAGALAIIAVILMYIAWRTGQAEWAIRRLTGENPPIAAERPAQQNGEAAGIKPPIQSAAPPANEQTSEAPAQSAQVPQEPSRQASRPSPDSATEDAKKTENNTASSDNATARRSSPPAASEQASTARDNGTEELATAQNYLKGGNQSAGRAEAAQWLWKAVAKKNTEATLLLSELYMKGEGVNKNCDQARILLDAAALRGNKEAGVRLRHMQAFGCP